MRSKEKKGERENKTHAKEENNRGQRNKRKKWFALSLFLSFFLSSPAAFSSIRALPAKSAPLFFYRVLSGDESLSPCHSARKVTLLLLWCERQEKKRTSVLFAVSSISPIRNGPVRAPAGAVLLNPVCHRCVVEIWIDRYLSLMKKRGSIGNAEKATNGRNGDDRNTEHST